MNETLKLQELLDALFADGEMKVIRLPHPPFISEYACCMTNYAGLDD